MGVNNWAPNGIANAKDEAVLHTNAAHMLATQAITRLDGYSLHADETFGGNTVAHLDPGMYPIRNYQIANMGDTSMALPNTQVPNNQSGLPATQAVYSQFQNFWNGASVPSQPTLLAQIQSLFSRLFGSQTGG